MQIHFIAPLSKAWNRMQKSLFQPFHIKKWFVLGFTAFLANLLEWEGGAGSDNDSSGSADLDDIINAPYDAWKWMELHPEWTSLIIFGICLLIGLIILVTWLSSRGKFMFLDNVVHDRALVRKPWAEFREVSRSLFLWRLGFGIVAALIIGSYMSHIYFELYEMYHDYATDREMVLVLVRMGILLLVLIIISSYISRFLNDFVVPLMYKTASNTWIGWSRFMMIFSKHFVYFIIYGLFYFILYMAVIIAVVVFGFITCCVGFVILVIPYIGSVLLLPVSVTFRAFSLEFLEQFGPEYKLFPDDSNATDEA